MRDPEKAVMRGEQARLLMSSPLVSEARQHIEAELWRQFQRASMDDTEALQFVKSMQYLHTKYFAFFERAIADGKLAALDIERKKKTLKQRVFG